MEGLKRGSYGVAYGARHSLQGFVTMWRLHWAPPSPQRSQKRGSSAKTESDTKVTYEVFKCVALNVCFLGLFSYVCETTINLIQWYFFRESESTNQIWLWMQPLLSNIFNVFLIVPAFGISRGINALWFNEIASKVYRHKQGRPTVQFPLNKRLADTIGSLVIECLFLLQGVLVSYIPVPGVAFILNVLHLSVLYSLYAFEYRWYNMGWELHHRLSFIENNAPYFIGFGLPLAAISSLPSSFIMRGIVFAVFFPILILSSHDVEPVTRTCSYKFQMFSPVVAVSNFLLNNSSTFMKLMETVFRSLLRVWNCFSNR